MFVPPVSTKILVRNSWRSGCGFLIERLQILTEFVPVIFVVLSRKRCYSFCVLRMKKTIHTVLLHFNLLVQEVLVVLWITQAKRNGICIVPSTVHRKKLKKQRLLSPFLFCLGAVWEGGREGRCREKGEGGGVRLESHIRGTTGKGVVSYCAPLSCLCLFLFVFAGSQHAPVCFSTHWSLSFQLVVYQCCHVSSSCSNQQERSRTGPGRLKITKTQSKGIVFGEFLPPSWDERNLRNKPA